MPLTGLILDEDRTITLECTQDIPIGHKVALKDLAVGDTVIKYGVDIGKVVQPVRKGQHAHVHNIKTNDGERSRSGRRSEARAASIATATGGAR